MNIQKLTFTSTRSAKTLRGGVSPIIKYQILQVSTLRAFSMSTTRLSNRPVGKKFVVACDGTWQNADMGLDTSVFAPPKVQIPSNVTRIVRALNHRDEKGISQISFYQRGIGTDGDFENKVVGGLTGNDISEHIREAYAFIANNFNPETQKDVLDETKPMDEIVLLGFSRGAYTARAIASLISDVGLLTKLGMESFWAIFGDWMKQDIAGRETEWFIATYSGVANDFQAKNGRKIKFTDKEYRQTLIDNGLTRWGMPIRALGVWDTVGALGIPMPWKAKNVKPYSFVNTKVAQAVQHAFHALAIDEHRGLFTPTLWEKPDPPSQLRLLKQCWFPGSHSNVGGSYADAGISNISLAWMVSLMEDVDGGILSFNPDYLDYVQDQNTKYYQTVKEAQRPWGFGRLYDSSLVTSPETLAQAIGPIQRNPGRYHKVDTETGQQGPVPLKGTSETIHRCVRVRIDGAGPGPEALIADTVIEKLIDLAKKALGKNPTLVAETKSYNPPALSNYTLIQSPQVKSETDHSSPGSSGVIWKSKDGLGDLPEEELGRTEIRLLKRSVQGKPLVK